MKFIHFALNIKRTKCISLVAYVFALNFVFIYANLHKPQARQMHSQPLNVNLAHRFKFTTAFFIKKLKILNFIRRLERGRECFFITFYLFLLKQKPPAPRNLAPKTQ
ncbi:hypothetical protein [Campylobacter concisus]|uniref:hypothetical protein n=1 Tax=Campylobacter concisus TaxID=199 RepID=UPI000D385960|nr:hypothetical protein [Campylobacter concisus]QPH92964.1 hypothetical protein CVT07_00385 [Campylobacter concisus]